MATKAILFGLMAASLFLAVAQGSSITIKNQCPHPVTACAQSKDGPISQFRMGHGDNKKLEFGPSNHWPTGAVWASAGGRCAAPDNPKAAADRNMANLAELHLPGDGDDFYDLSNVDAYDIGLMINPTKIAGDRPRKGFSCGRPTCTIEKLRNFCTGKNKLVEHPSGLLTCRNVDGPGLVATPSTERFKKECRTSYSYSKDDATSMYACSSGTDYEVVFCPGKSDASLVGTI